MLEPNKLNFEKRKYKKKGKMHYSTKNYNNPFFDKKSKRGKSLQFSYKIKAILIAILVVLVALIWFLFYSKTFIIYNVYDDTY